MKMVQINQSNFLMPVIDCLAEPNPFFVCSAHGCGSGLTMTGLLQ
jgi:hypothetical protein